MKKWIIIVGLTILVVWGVYDLSNKQARVDEQLIEHAEIEDEQIPLGLNWGERAPNFTLLTMDGEEKKLSDFRGKKVMINFWASWCPPCVEEMPDMQKYYEAHRSDDFVVLAVNLAETEMGMGDVANFIDEFGLTFPVVLDEDSLVAASYQVRTIPTTYMLNSNGVVEEKIIGPMTYDIMEELMDPIK